MPAESEASVSAEADWRNAYKSFLTDLCQRETAVRNIDRPDYDPDTYGSELSAQSSGYCLYDIDEDGVPEMFVRYGSGEADYLTRVYTCLEGVVAQAGEFPSGHASLYTWPGENAVAYDWGHMGGHFVDKITLEDGGLTQEIFFEEGTDGPAETYTEVADLVPGSLYLWENRTILGRDLLAEGTTGREVPLTLPIDDYGKPQERAEIDPARDQTARAAIQAALDGESPLIGVSADGFGGDTGEMLLDAYLAPGGVDIYAKSPQTIQSRTWLDMNGDGQAECLLILADQYVLLAETDGAVYAYCINYSAVFYTVSQDSVFRSGSGGNDAFAVSFDREQVCLYTVTHDAAAVLDAVWEEH